MLIKRFRAIHVAAVVSILSLMLTLGGCNTEPGYRSAEGGVWGTTYHITYRSDRDMHDSIIMVMKQVERSLSPFSDSSLIAAVNRGERVKADTLLARIFAESQRVNRESGGAFDPTVAPLVNLWGFGYRDTGIEPTREAIDSMLALVGIADCSIDADGYVVKKHPETEFNFSAITKGYGCDLVGDMLRRNGCEDYMVEIGGEIALAGESPRGGDWRIMIDAPIDCDTAIVHQKMAVVALTGRGVATSGNYRNFRETRDGGRSWHTISPVDGRPAETDLLSVTVIAGSCMLADAYATASMARSAADALGMLDSLSGVEGLLVTRDTMFVTSGFPEIQ